MDSKEYAQLVEVFKAELDESLLVMTDCLLTLEKKPKSKNNKETIDKLFRAAHSIKGAAKSLGFDDIGEISHSLENLFSCFREGILKLNEKTLDVVFKAMDAIKDSMINVTSEKKATLDIENILSEVNEISKAEVSKKNKKNTHKHSKETKPKPKTNQDQTLISDTIRVSLSKIDTISALSEELQGIKLRNDDLIERLGKISTHFTNAEHNISKIINFFKLNKTDANSEIEMIVERARENNAEISALINEIFRSFRDNNTDCGIITESMQKKIRVMRLIPTAVIFQPLMRTVRDMAQDLEKKINFNTKGESIEIDRFVLESLKDPLLHIIRNSIDHGVEDEETRKNRGKSLEGNINIEVKEEGGDIHFSISDDGGGIDEKAVKQMAISKKMISEEDAKKLTRDEALNLIFLPGLSTKEIITDLSGRGVGMDVVLRNIQKIKGTLAVESKSGKGTTIHLKVPLTLATDRGMLIYVSGQMFIIPTISIWRIIHAETEEIHRLEGKMVLNFENEMIPVFSLSEILNLKSEQLGPKQKITLLVLYLGAAKVALIVSSIHSEREIAIKSLLPPLSDAKFITGATLTGRGEVVLVLSPADIIASTQERQFSALKFHKEIRDKQIKILVVEDSITTRTLETDILLNKGFDAKSVSNGMEAWEILQREKYDLVITDIDMPVMDGFELTHKIKTDDSLKDIPVIIVTSMGNENDKRRGIEVGANAYIVKSQFETQGLLSLIEDMVGPSENTEN